MPDDDARRRELADFLRARRAHADRIAVGLPASAGRRGGGLRREEVAALSGVSITWYTWLEQARAVNPSRQVLTALARTFGLTDSETAYLLSLAGYASEPGESATDPVALRALLDALPGSPAFTLAPTWAILDWNDAYAALYPAVAATAEADRNLLWAVYLDPFVRELLPDWPTTSRRFLAEFRGHAGPRLGDRQFRAVVDHLLQRSAEFRADWQRHDVEGFASRRRSFRTAAGVLDFDYHRLTPADRRDLDVVIYTPADRRTAGRLGHLRRAATVGPAR
jgi:transcriptional regulator with XRE-family HTH domain